jgi:hypothetical protein
MDEETYSMEATNGSVSDTPRVDPQTPIPVMAAIKTSGRARDPGNVVFFRMQGE